MTIRKSTMADLEKLMEIYAGARERMAAAGNPHQWGDQGYPPRELIRQDIEQGISYAVLDDEGHTVGTFCFFTEPEPDYAVIHDGAWLNDAPYGTIHRVAGDGKARGIVAAAVAYCTGQIPELRMDTHCDNHAMQHVLTKIGFVHCGTIIIGADGTERMAYQLSRS